jgi:hypothetical protein
MKTVVVGALTLSVALASAISLAEGPSQINDEDVHAGVVPEVLKIAKTADLGSRIEPDRADPLLEGIRGKTLQVTENLSYRNTWFKQIEFFDSQYLSRRKSKVTATGPIAEELFSWMKKAEDQLHLSSSQTGDSVSISGQFVTCVQDSAAGVTTCELRVQKNEHVVISHVAVGENAAFDQPVPGYPLF